MGTLESGSGTTGGTCPTCKQALPVVNTPSLDPLTGSPKYRRLFQASEGPVPLTGAERMRKWLDNARSRDIQMTKLDHRLPPPQLALGDISSLSGKNPASLLNNGTGPLIDFESEQTNSQLRSADQRVPTSSRSVRRSSEPDPLLTSSVNVLKNQSEQRTIQLSGLSKAIPACPIPNLRIGSNCWQPGETSAPSSQDPSGLPVSADIIMPFVNDVYVPEYATLPRTNDPIEDCVEYKPFSDEIIESRCILLSNLPAQIGQAHQPRALTLADILDHVRGGRVVASCLQTITVGKKVSLFAWINFAEGSSASTFVTACQRARFVLGEQTVRVSLISKPSFPLDDDLLDLLDDGGSRCLILTHFPKDITRGQFLRSLREPTDLSSAILQLKRPMDGSIHILLSSIISARNVIHRLGSMPVYRLVQVNYGIDPCEGPISEYTKRAEWQQRERIRDLVIAQVTDTALKYDDSIQTQFANNNKENVSTTGQTAIEPASMLWKNAAVLPKTRTKSSLRPTAPEFRVPAPMTDITNGPLRDSSSLWLGGMTGSDFANSRVVSEPLFADISWYGDQNMENRGAMARPQTEGILIDIS